MMNGFRYALVVLLFALAGVAEPAAARGGADAACASPNDRSTLCPPDTADGCLRAPLAASALMSETPEYHPDVKSLVRTLSDPRLAAVRPQRTLLPLRIAGSDFFPPPTQYYVYLLGRILI